METPVDNDITSATGFNRLMHGSDWDFAPQVIGVQQLNVLCNGHLTVCCIWPCDSKLMNRYRKW